MVTPATRGAPILLGMGLLRRKSLLDPLFEALKLESNELSYRVNGFSTLGKWPYIGFVIGALVNVLFGFGGYFFIGWAVGTGIEYLVCRDRPKQYLEQAFKAVQFEVG